MTILQYVSLGIKQVYISTPAGGALTPLFLMTEFHSYFEKEWASFQEINDSSNSSPVLLWETGKAFSLLEVVVKYNFFKNMKLLSEQNNDTCLLQKLLV